VPAIARDFGLTVETAALIASAFAFPYAFAQPILGPIADAVGKARVIKICLGVLLAALLLGAAATSFEMLFAARVIAGFAGGGIIPVAFAIIGDRVPLVERQVALSRLVMASQISILLGTTLGGIIAATYGWRWMFVAPSLLALLALGMMLVYLPPRPGAPRHPVSIARMRSGYGETFANPLAAVCLVGVFLEGVAMIGLQPFIAGRLEALGQGSLTEAGFVLAAYSLGAIVFTLLVRRLLDRFGRANLVRIGGAVACAALIGAALAASWQQQALAFFFAGVGFFMIHNSLQAIGTELAPNARGSGVALFAFVFFMGQAAGPPLYRIGFARLGDTAPILLGAAVLVLTAAWIGRGIATVDRRATAPATD
jgi:predicted MFS family arabinose efflux permease